MIRHLIIVSFVGLAACSSGIDQKSDKTVVVTNNGTADMGTAEDSGNSGTDMAVDVDLGGPTSEPDGPEILDLSVSPRRITEGGTVTVNALLSDPQGFDDIGGGRLISAGGDVVGLFSGSGGAYTFTVTWDTLHGVEPIEFATGTTRIYTAEFFDAADHRATQQISIELHCDGGPACDGVCGEELCNGSCTPIAEYESDPSNCGSCGNVCAKDLCENSACLECVPSDVGMESACDPICQTGCTGADACVAGEGGAFDCGAPGSVGLNGTCPNFKDCAAGLVCISQTGDPNDPQAICLQMCSINTNECPSGQGCMSVDFYDLGVCFPNN